MRNLGRLLGFAALAGAALLLPTSGCGKKDGAGGGNQPGGTQGAGQNPHEHPDEGPNGGVLAEWGKEKYHPEFKPDHAKQQATVWIHDGHVKKYVPIDAKTIQLTITNVTPPVDITLTADPQETDPTGKSSRFVGTHKILATEMEYKGTISGKVGDTPYSGRFEEKDHHKKEKK